MPIYQGGRSPSLGRSGCWATGMPVIGRAVDPAVSGLRAERTSLISLADDACRFRVVRTDDPLAPSTDELHQRFSGEQATG